MDKEASQETRTIAYYEELGEQLRQLNAKAGKEFSGVMAAFKKQEHTQTFEMMKEDARMFEGLKDIFVEGKIPQFPN